MTWEKVRLGDVLKEAKSGFACGSKEETGVAQIRMNNVTRDGNLVWNKVRRVPPPKNLDKLLLCPGDILFNSTNSPNLVGKSAFFNGFHEPLTFSNHFLRLRPSAGILDGSFLARCLVNEFQHGTFEHLCKRWVNQAAVSKEDLFALEIPLPPLAEQKRLAAILDRADELRRARRKVLLVLDELAQSLFLELFGDPATNPKGWETHHIKDMAFVKGGKRLPKGAEYSMSPTAFRYIRVTNLKAGVIEQNQLLYLTPEIQKQIARYVVNEGDVIISIAGSIGITAAVPASLNGANLTENAAKIVPKTKTLYNAEYMSWVLRTEMVQSQIRASTGQVTIGKLALFRIENLKIPLPPLPLQQQFAAQITQLETIKARARASLDEMDALFASLQARAFSGELSGAE